jgi:hypothetical protein
MSLGVAAANPALNPQQALETGRFAYERGNYGEAVDTVYPLLYPSVELRNEEAVIEAHRLLTLSYLFMKKTGEAEQEAAALLALRPDYEPDPVIDPPAAVSFFHAIKKKQDDRLREIRERQKEEDERARREEEKKKAEARAKAERVYVERVVVKNYRVIGFIPFGAGQFQNRQIGYGIGFAVSEAVLGAAWIALTVTINQKYPGGAVPVSSTDRHEHDVANYLSGFQLGTAAAFWAVVAWGIIDAQVKFVPERIIETRELHGPPSPPPAKKVKPKFSIAPIVAPGLYGLGAQGAW